MVAPSGLASAPHSCSLCAHRPMSLCPAPTAACGHPRGGGAGPLATSAALNSDNFSPATAAQLCPTPASWGSEPSPGAAAVIYKVNFIKFVTIPCFPCWEVQPLATRLSGAPYCLPGSSEMRPRLLQDPEAVHQAAWPAGGSRAMGRREGVSSDLFWGEEGPSNSPFHG